jgi:hypothetical protein
VTANTGIAIRDEIFIIRYENVRLIEESNFVVTAKLDATLYCKMWLRVELEIFTTPRDSS